MVVVPPRLRAPAPVVGLHRRRPAAPAAPPVVPPSAAAPRAVHVPALDLGRGRHAAPVLPGRPLPARRGGAASDGAPLVPRAPAGGGPARGGGGAAHRGARGRPLHVLVGGAALGVVGVRGLRRAARGGRAGVAAHAARVVRVPGERRAEEGEVVRAEVQEGSDDGGVPGGRGGAAPERGVLHAGRG